MPQITIKNRWTESVLFAFEASDEQQASGLAVRYALEAAKKSGANLCDADLRGANLRDSNLRDADLRGANLIGSNLSGSNLRGANLIGSNLRGANLIDAKIIGSRPVFQIGPLGSRQDLLFAFGTDQGLRFKTGCFFGTRDEFISAISETHGESIYGVEYAAALVLIDAHFSAWSDEEKAGE